MRSDTYGIKPGASSGGYPVLIILATLPTACFGGALLTDLAYAASANIMWSDFSAWLLAAGMVGAVVAALTGLVTLFVRRRRIYRKPVWPTALCSAIVLVVALLDNLIHSRDGWTSVVPLGLTLSALTVLVTFVTAWLAFRPDNRQAGTRPFTTGAA